MNYNQDYFYKARVYEKTVVVFPIYRNGSNGQTRYGIPSEYIAELIEYSEQGCEIHVECWGAGGRDLHGVAPFECFHEYPPVAADGSIWIHEYELRPYHKVKYEEGRLNE